jgi:hypothetical protein
VRWLSGQILSIIVSHPFRMHELPICVAQFYCHYSVGQCDAAHMRPKNLKIPCGLHLFDPSSQFLHEQAIGTGMVKNEIQNLVQSRAEKAPISPLGSSLLH